MPSYVVDLMNWLKTSGSMEQVAYYSQLILNKDWQAIKHLLPIIGL